MLASSTSTDSESEITPRGNPSTIHNGRKLLYKRRGGKEGCWHMQKIASQQSAHLCLQPQAPKIRESMEIPAIIPLLAKYDCAISSRIFRQQDPHRHRLSNFRYE